MQQDHTTHGTVIGQGGTYAVILRHEHLEFYETNKGPWEKRNAPDFLLTPEETESLYAFLTTLQIAPEQERKNKRFHAVTITALSDIQDRALQQPLELRYSAAYGILRGYFEALLTIFAASFPPDQLGEIRIILDQLTKATGEDTHLSEEARNQVDCQAQTLREAEQES